MAKHSKTTPPKFTGELAMPILVPDLPQKVDEGKFFLTPAMLERFRKLDILAAHYNALRDGKIDFFVLSLAMAIDLVPGFKILYDDPVARALNLPNAYRGKTKPKGAGTLPETFSGQVLELLFQAGKTAFPDKSEVELSEMIAKCLIPDLERPQRASDRKKASKTLRNRLANARRDSRSMQD